MSDRKYRPVYMVISAGLILMIVMMNYSFNLMYYIQNRIYENAVKTLFPANTFVDEAEKKAIRGLYGQIRNVYLD